MTTKHQRRHPCGSQYSTSPPWDRVRVTRSRFGRVWIIFRNGELVFFGSKQETEAWLRGGRRGSDRRRSRPILNRGPLAHAGFARANRWLV